MPFELQNNRNYFFEKSHISLHNYTNFKLNLIKMNDTFALLFSSKNSIDNYKILVLPTQFNLIFNASQLFLLCVRSQINLRFLNLLLNSFNTLQILYSQLVIKGNGYKVVFNAKITQLDLKVGLTHKQNVVIPTINFIIPITQKTNILFFSYDKNVLGNLKGSLLRLRKTNSYTGKGILVYHQQQQKVKLVNKKTK